MFLLLFCLIHYFCKRLKLSLFLFVDAFGWEILKKNQNFLKDEIVDKKPLKTIFGYSSACDPSIISGKTPNEHGHWNSFYYSPKTCPYKWLKWLRFLPDFIMNHHRVRSKLSRLIKKIHGFTGYFMLYNVPFKYLPYFDYAEKYRIWEPGGLNQGRSIFDELHENHINYHVHQYGQSDDKKLDLLKHKISNKSIKFAYVSMGGLDSLMHKVGTESETVDKKISWYDQKFTDLLELARENYKEVNFYVFTDHGMHNTHTSCDLQKEIKDSGLRFGRDYVAIYDSTMARFWYKNDTARIVLRDLLNSHEGGRILKDQELQEFGVYFEDHQFGEDIFMMNSGVKICPSFMGQNFTPGLHGYHPDDADSYAQICGNKELPEDMESIKDIYNVMTNEMNWLLKSA